MCTRRMDTYKGSVRLMLLVKALHTVPQSRECGFEMRARQPREYQEHERLVFPLVEEPYASSMASQGGRRWACWYAVPTVRVDLVQEFCLRWTGPVRMAA